MAEYFLADPPSSVIGPQIGPVYEPPRVKITIALPGQTQEHLTCCLYVADGTKIAEERSAPQHSHFRNFIFTFAGLEAGKRYSYKFFGAGDRELDLEGSLSYADCWFDAPVFNAGDKFVLLSCNNPFESKKSEDEQFRMWAVLHDRVMNDPSVKLLV